MVRDHHWAAWRQDRSNHGAQLLGISSFCGTGWSNPSFAGALSGKFSSVCHHWGLEPSHGCWRWCEGTGHLWSVEQDSVQHSGWAWPASAGPNPDNTWSLPLHTITVRTQFAGDICRCADEQPVDFTGHSCQVILGDGDAINIYAEPYCHQI